MRPVEDRLISMRLRAGDDAALAAAYDRHAPLVLGIARKVMGGGAGAEDVVQEVFTLLWCNPVRFDPERGSLRTYLGLLTHRVAVDTVRNIERRRSREERAEAGVPEVVDPGEAAAVAEAVRLAILRLPEEQRQAVELTFWQGMTNREVANRLGVAEGTIKSRLRLAGVKLRDLLGPLEMESA